MKHGNLTFITGAPRTGTSLTLQLCGKAAGASAFSQPLPLLLIALKAEFLSHIDSTPRWHLKYPIADQIFATSYDTERFRIFLESKSLGHDEIHRQLRTMGGYSGQYFKPKKLFASLNKWERGNLIDFAEIYFRTHSRIKNPKAIIWKETFAEEFIPYFLSRNAKVIITIRDPRDAINSQLNGNYESHSGRPRPILFILRQWRKAAANALALKSHPNVMTVRYEDLVSEGASLVRVMHEFAGVPNSSNTSTDAWLGNSSFQNFQNLSQNSTGRYKQYLADDLIKFIEAACYAEMLAFDYPVDVSLNNVEQILENGPCIDFLERKELSEYQYSTLRRREEKMRFKGLRARNVNFDSSMYIFEEAFTQLRDQIKS